MRDGRPEVIPTGFGNLLPSVVTFLENGKVMVGHPAKRILESSENNGLRQNTFSSIKRLIGKTKVDVERSTIEKTLLQRLSPSIDENHNVLLKCSHLPSGAISPEDISTLVLRKLIGLARDHLQALGMDSNVTNAVITVPAYFNDRQRKATERAGMRAGLLKVKLITEPEAAALAYSLSNNHLKQVVMVLDLGGGTFDVSFLEVGQGITETLIIGGDSNLGGDDFDATLYRYLLKQYALHHAIKDVEGHVLKHLQLRNELHLRAKEAKTALSVETSVNITIPDLGSHQGFTLNVTRAKFEGLCTDLFRRIREPILKLATAANIDLPGLSGGKLDRSGVALDQYDTIDWKSVPAKVLLNDTEVQRLNLIELKKQQRQGKERFRTKRNSKTKINGTYVSPEADFAEEFANLQPITTIHEVVLVGGASRMPGVINLVKKLTGSHPLRTLNPDEAICLGAGVMSGILDGHVGEMRVVSQMESAVLKFLAEEKMNGNTELFEWMEKQMKEEEAEEGETASNMLSEINRLVAQDQPLSLPNDDQDQEVNMLRRGKVNTASEQKVNAKVSVFRRSRKVSEPDDQTTTVSQTIDRIKKPSVFRRKSS